MIGRVRAATPSAAALGNTVRAELIKLRTLPAVPLTGSGTIAAAIALAAALAHSRHPAPPAATAVLAAVPYLQVGFILLGALAGGAEYAGSQIRSTLVAVPGRVLALTGKAAAYLVSASGYGAVTVAGGLAGAWVTGMLRSGAPGAAGPALWQVAGAVVYLVLIGLLTCALAVALRGLIPALVTMLGLVLIVSPLVARFTEQARWLPDRAGSHLYQHGSGGLAAPWGGAYPLLVWIAVAGTVAALGFILRDA